MHFPAFSGARLGLRALALLAVAVVATAGMIAPRSPLPAVPPAIVSVVDTAGEETAGRGILDPVLEDSLRGRSGKLFARFVSPRQPLAVEMLRRFFGDDAARSPGLLAFVDSAIGGPEFTFITLRPFTDKTEGRIGRYRIGFWPGERRTVKKGYENPEGFIEVTKETQDTRISEHFRLRDFLTKGQADVWPKYLVLREDLVDKLELVIDDLGERGIEVTRMRVMSGFRTPQYNANGGSTAGRASNSRHMYGDAADVFVDNDGDWRMDDLNGDGRSETRDAAVIRAAVERVERAHPDLTGGVGLYRATSAHGPFAHVDVRGYRARWGGE